MVEFFGEKRIRKKKGKGGEMIDGGERWKEARREKRESE